MAKSSKPTLTEHGFSIEKHSIKKEITQKEIEVKLVREVAKKINVKINDDNGQFDN